MARLNVRTKARTHQYKVVIGSGILQDSGRIARGCLGTKAQRIALISNRRVFSLYGPALLRSLKASGFVVWPWLIEDGERHKSLTAIERILGFLAEAQLDRGDALLTLGGGIVGDVGGFAAAVYLRGIPFIQVPTTLLAQIDSSVGGKTGVNLPAGKNLVGSFHQPAAVIIDVKTLDTLPSRELVAGWCECVKQGAVGGRKLFNQTTELLKKFHSLPVPASKNLEKLIAAHCAFKASIVANDEREEVARRDSRSRRILNFGHTVAHALEAVTNYRRFRHGEAVGRGMLVAGHLSKNLGLFPPSELKLLVEAVSLCGRLPPADDLNEQRIIKAIARDKKRSAGYVQWVILERIGRPRIIDGKEISSALLKKSLRDGLRS